MLHGMGIETGVDLAAVAGGLARARRPARPGAALPLPPGRPAPARGGGAVSETATILVVDDLPANRDLMARRLERSGFRVVSAAQRARGARAASGARPVDLVLLDIMMPGMTGLDVLQHRAHDAARRRRCRS